MKEYLVLTIKSVIFSFIFISTIYVAQRLFNKDKYIVEQPQTETSHIINVARRITSFTTGSGAKVEIYKHEDITIVVSEKNGIVSVSVK